MAQADQQIRVRVPYRFIRDCFECDCDVGDYRGGHLIANHEQLAELVNRAKHYAGGGTDQSPRGLPGAARSLLEALKRGGAL